MRIANEFDISDSLSQLVERSAGSHQQRCAARGWNDAMRTPIQKSYTDRMLQDGNRLRDRGSRYTELGAGFRHAAVFNDGQEDEQVTQPQSAANLLVPLDRCSHKEST